MRTVWWRLSVLLLAALLAVVLGACAGTPGVQSLLTIVTPPASTASPAGPTLGAATAGPQATSGMTPAARATGLPTVAQVASAPVPGNALPSAPGHTPAADLAAATAVVPLPTRAAPGAGPQPLPAFGHVFIIIMENHESDQIAGSPNAPYMNRLAQQYGRAAAYYGIGHPSLPNYLALIGGDTFGIASDCLDCYIKGENLVDQLERAGKSWKAYMEDMPRPCFTEPYAGDYAQRHNPFIYFDDIRTDLTRCGKVVPLTQLDDDLRGGTVPDFTWITPNVCNDMHDCPVATGDQWLETWVSKILASSAWKQNGVLFILFDEGTTGAGCCRYAEGGQVDALVVSSLARPGFVSQTPYNHYSVLRTIETAWRLPLLGKAACDCTSAMADFFTGNVPATPGP